jgi:prephenate dehydrogenase
LDRRLGIEDFRSVAVVGRGLIGGSIELALRERGLPVVALDRGDDLRRIDSAALVVLCAPVRANLEILDGLRNSVAPVTLITDVGSTKAAMTAAAAGMRFIGGHPVAGAAQGGLAHARGDLFEHRPWILTRGGGSAEDEARLERFVASLGAQPAWMAPDDHDRLFAFISHLPQLTISALMDVVSRGVGADGLRLAGEGLRDSTRLASSPAGVWQDILATNRPAIVEALDALIAALTRLRDDRTGAVLEETFARARAARSSLK